ncbi:MULTISPECIES: peptidoglycan-binding protein LysM [Tenacibaculum]|uniref:Peptidoglycan-binding protein LysM n=1 Tax=Tenacibaculum mesophilum TaxID=104268 RepID=A0AAE9MS18_9FLAO|nr:peptidoglycan-binding protein LysM [Tenacibaculum mesophilum]MCG7501483.1 peptidoglycan-binding protein LysM [Tenacibaculum sp. Mcav3-52]MCO7184765.1 peptidoglycan-binding protein LysM [Tenacibaculum sp. XPcli2-G]AZJ33867.1 peptidoglycan-binding protein LysM [Tenacibaculum mesophilum]QFS29799.1 peptidoglycan-binding protein LysM [Tenacibaculum mesophilum]UTD16760.1 peptidoglycan-binding protein LysM [Tenacibaculum mesophilum]
MFAALNRKYLIIRHLVLVFLGFVLLTSFTETTTKKEKTTTTTPIPIHKVEKVNIPFLLNDFVGFKEALAFKESQGRYRVVNTLGYLGKYQFGKETLKRFRIYNTTHFLRNPELQERTFVAYCKLNKWILRKDIKRSVGKTINGVKITESGILAAAHLSGAGNVKKFLRSNGSIRFNDAYGTSIQSYLKKFAGYDVSNIKANKKPTV